MRFSGHDEALVGITAVRLIEEGKRRSSDLTGAVLLKPAKLDHALLELRSEQFAPTFEHLPFGSESSGP